MELHDNGSTRSLNRMGRTDLLDGPVKGVRVIQFGVSRTRGLLYVLLSFLALPAIGAAAQSGNQYSPTFSPGYLIAWWVCSSRKRRPIGGWLLFFYWQLYAGLLVSVAMWCLTIQSYVPENFDDSRKFWCFLASAVPGLVLFSIKCCVATLLLSARLWGMLKLLRYTIVAELVAALVGVAIDSVYFPDNIALSLLTIIPDLIWLLYFFKSRRIEHIFKQHDWTVAVDGIYPLKPAVSA